jgi:hypothetical protein
MKYVDYDWDIKKDRIVLDELINVDKLGWKHGDYFRLENVDGKVQLVKVDPLLKFVKGFK